MSKDDKAKALELALTQIEKDFGKEAIMKLGEKSAKTQIESIPTGALPLDIAIGIGGIPRGRVAEDLEIAGVIRDGPAIRIPATQTVREIPGTGCITN